MTLSRCVSAMIFLMSANALSSAAAVGGRLRRNVRFHQDFCFNCSLYFRTNLYNSLRYAHRLSQMCCHKSLYRCCSCFRRSTLRCCRTSLSRNLLIDLHMSLRYSRMNLYRCCMIFHQCYLMYCHTSQYINCQLCHLNKILRCFRKNRNSYYSLRMHSL